MSFPRHPKYKNSDVGWLSEVPAHWKMSPLKYLVTLKSGSTPSKTSPAYWDGDVPWASAKDLKTEVLSDTQDHITQRAIDDEVAQLVPAGSILVVVRGMILAHTFPVATALVPMAINQDLKALIPSGALNSRFLAWLLRGSASETISRVDEAGHGTKALRMEAWASMPFPIAPLGEQLEIAAFLDRETARLDELVAEQHRLIDLLREKRQAVISHAVTKGLNPDASMKPSGIEWLGEVPAHWVVAPVAYRYDVQLGKMLDQTKITGDHLRSYLRVFDVQWGRINTQDLPRMDFDQGDRLKYQLRPGDLLVNEGGSYPGRSAIWLGEIEECFFQKALHRLRARNPEMDTTQFFFYVMSWAANQGVFIAGGNETTIEHLPAEKLKKYRFTFPPVGEQVEIASFLDCELSKLDALVKEAGRAIELLQERRTALISAAVTGQIDVRAFAEREAA